MIADMEDIVGSIPVMLLVCMRGNTSRGSACPLRITTTDIILYLSSLKASTCRIADTSSCGWDRAPSVRDSIVV